MRWIIAQNVELDFLVEWRVCTKMASHTGTRWSVGWGGGRISEFDMKSEGGHSLGTVFVKSKPAFECLVHQDSDVPPPHTGMPPLSPLASSFPFFTPPLPLPSQNLFHGAFNSAIPPFPPFSSLLVQPLLFLAQPSSHGTSFPLLLPPSLL